MREEQPVSSVVKKKKKETGINRPRDGKEQLENPKTSCQGGHNGPEEKRSTT